MKQVLYERGYIVRVVSWENDADYYYTKEVHVDTKEEAKNWYDLAMLFYGDATNRKIGNIYSPREENIKNTFIQFVSEHEGFYGVSLTDTDEDIKDALWDAAYSLGLTGSEFYSRVCEKVEIWFFEEAVYYTVISR